MLLPHAAPRCGRVAILAIALAMPALARPVVDHAAEVVRARRYVLADTVAPPPPAPGRAVLWIAREEFVRTRPLPPELVYLDDAPVSELPQRSWFAVPLEPGTHRLCGTVDVPAMQFSCAAGDTVFLRLRELVDNQDRRTMDWLFDDPASVVELIGSRKLSHVETTGAGRRHLVAKRKGGCADVDLPAPPADPGRFESMLIERPLNQMDVQHDFQHETGTVWVGDDGLHWRMHARVQVTPTEWRTVGDSLDLPADRIGRVRFGGTRYTGVTPWVTLDVRDDEGRPSRVSFADSREDHGVATYQRLFEQLGALGRGRRTAGGP